MESSIPKNIHAELLDARVHELDAVHVPWHTLLCDAAPAGCQVHYAPALDYRRTWSWQFCLL
jgi:hypothetical protein